MSVGISLRRTRFRTEEVTAAPTADGMMLIHLPAYAITCTPEDFHDFVEQVWSTYFAGAHHAALLASMLPARRTK